MAVGKGPGPAKGPKVDLDDLKRRWEADKKSRLFLQLADEYRRQDQVDTAIGVLREGLKAHPTFVPAHVALARCLMAKGQPAQAQAELEPIHKKSPDNMLAGKLLAEVLAERGEGGRALAVLKSLLPFAIDDPEVGERIAALESRLTTPSTKSTGSGDTAEFATGDFASSTGSMGRPGATPAAAAPPSAPSAMSPAPTPASSAAAVLGPSGDDDVLGTTSADDASGASADDDVIVIDEPVDAIAGDDDVLSSDDDVLVVSDDESDEPAPVLPPMPKPAESPADLLGAPLAAATSAPRAAEEDDFMSVTLAELHESQGAFPQAIAIYERLLARRPGDATLKSALDRCKAKLGGADVATSVIEAVAAPTPSVARPRWEPIRARSAAPAETAAAPAPPNTPVTASANVFADDEGPMGLLGAPAAPSTPAPAPAPAPARAAGPPPAKAPAPARAAAGPAASAAQLRATAAHLRRWLDAVAAVRQ